MVPVASIVTGTLVKFHIRYTSVVRTVYFKIFRILSSSHCYSYLLRVQYLLSHMFLFNNNNNNNNK